MVVLRWCVCVHVCVCVCVCVWCVCVGGGGGEDKGGEGGSEYHHTSQENLLVLEFEARCANYG